MAKNKKNEISTETQDEALVIARKTQKPGQTKEQTRLIAQGIQKGIAEYKKTAKEKLRQADKANKKKKREQQQQQVTEVEIETVEEKNSKLPWLLLGLSWAAFGIYFLSQI
ncbi:DUF2956 domain-containing protein [Psychromonas ossibalaenae]|uniref:DUF2956 domain-containing protein n=1 Tax=Psychromonas ossibalaenae TaxID=444922 RepID=UPI00036CB64A|nr:DUF2956 domain-containing protein [Psychromonas ossibalaenae]